MAKQYDQEFKNDALKYREDNPHLTVAAVCRNLGISTLLSITGRNQQGIMMVKYFIVDPVTLNPMKQKK